MEKQIHNPLPFYIIKQLEKREKLIQLYYGTGRPIFNQINDNKHIFIEENNKTRGSYY